MLKRLLPIVLTILLFAAIQSNGYAQTLKDFSRASLKGLKQVTTDVSVRDSEDLAAAGVTVDRLRVHLEAELRKSGIKVNEKASAMLWLDICVVPVGDGRLALMINLELNQPALIGKDKNMFTIAATWTDSELQVVGVSRLSVGRIDGVVESFVNDWLAANP